MKNYKLGLAIFTLITVAGLANNAQAQTATPTPSPVPANPKNLVTITGNLDPSYSIEMTEADRIAIAKGLEGINNLPVISVDINSIYSEKDKPAFEAASKEVSRVILEASKTIVNMRAIVYKLDIALQRNNSTLIEEKIYEVLNKHFQKSFTTLLQLFIGTGGNFNKKLTEAMENCFSYTCVQDIAAAQLDLVSFGRAINHRIDLDSSRHWTYSHDGFKSRLVKDAVRETVDRVLKVNESESVYVKVLRAAASPFAAVASGAVQSIENLGNFIRSNNAAKFQIAANPIILSRKQWLADMKSFETIIANNFEIILDKNNGARLYQSPINAPMTNDLNISISDTMSKEFSNQLEKLDQAFMNLSKTNSLDNQTASDMLMGMISSAGEGYKKYLDSQLLPVLESAKASGLVSETQNNFAVSIPHSYFNTVTSFYGNDMYNRYGSIVGKVEYYNNSYWGQIPMSIVANAGMAVRIFILQSAQSSGLKFAIITEDKTSNYIINNNGKIRINKSPIPLTVKLTKISN